MIETFSVLFFADKAYFPTHTRLGNSLSYVLTEPVIVTTLSHEALLEGFNILQQAGHPQGPSQLTREFWKTYTNPLLKATNAKSQKRLRAGGLFYTVVWEGDQIRLSMPQPNPKERLQDPNGVQLVFPLDTTIEAMLNTIMTNMTLLRSSA